MISPFEKTPAEKEEDIVDLIEHGYSYPQIMKECHVSPSTISSVKKRLFGTTDNDYFKTGKISKESQAFRLFQQGKSLVEVKTEVDIDSADVIEYLRRYQELRGADMYSKGYEKVKGNITPFLQMFDLMNSLGLTPQQVQEQIRYGYDLPRLQSIHAKMNSQIQDMAGKHCYLDSQLESAAKQLQEHKNSLQYYDFQCVQRRNQIKRLDSTINRKKRIIQRLDNTEGYNKIKEAARKETQLVLHDKRALLALAISATFEALRRYPASQELVFNLKPGFTNEYQQFLIDAHKNELVELGAHIRSEIIEKITRKTTDTMENIVTV